jgi:hypothetical protein
MLYAECKDVKALTGQHDFDTYLDQTLRDSKFEGSMKNCISESDFNYLLSDDAKNKGWILPTFNSLAQFAALVESKSMTDSYLTYYKNNYKSSASETLREGFAILFREKTPYVLDWLSKLATADQKAIINDSSLGFTNIYGASVLRNKTIRRIVGTNWETTTKHYRNAKILLNVAENVRLFSSKPAQ